VGNGITVLVALVGYPFIIDAETADEWIDRRVGRVFRQLRMLRISEDFRNAWRNVLMRFVLTLSDVQVATSLAIIIIAFSKPCSIRVYPFSVVSDPICFSMETHDVAFWIIRDFFLERRLLLVLRVVLMGCMASLMIASVVLQGHHQWS
jgi:hypothetical protein